MGTKYSFCTTVYNTVETITGFYESISKSMDDSSEFVVVDSFSKDGTYEKLLEIKNNDPRVKVIREKCTRGRGRQLAIENSKGDIIIMIFDADAEYYNIDKYLKEFENYYENKLVRFFANVKGFNIHFIVGERKVFDMIQGFPNLNASEDVYLFKVAEGIRILENKIIQENDVKPIPIRGLFSGNERRYATNFFEMIKRRIIATRDNLFVFNYTPNQLFEKFQLKGIKKYVIGFPLFTMGKILRFTIKDKPVEKRIESIVYSIQLKDK